MRCPLFLFLITLSLYGSAQSSLSYSIKHYTDANGLPQNSIKSIIKDDAGYLWMATEGGLTRFDGNNFMLFDKAYTHTKSNRIYSFRRDLKNGALYAQSEHHELIPINKGRVLPHPIPYRQTFPNLNPRVQMQELPFLNTENGKFDIQVNSLTYYNITTDSVYFHSTQSTIAMPFKRKEQYNFFVSDRQLFHLETNGKLTLIEKGTAKHVSIGGDLQKSKDTQTARIKIYWNGAMDQIFFIVGKSIYQVNYDGKHLNTTLIIEGFNFEKQQIGAIYYDINARKLFLGSPTKGLFVLQLHQFYPEKSSKELNSSVKYALHPFGEHEVLFANGDLLNTNGEMMRLPLLNSNSRNFTIAIDDQKNIWVAKDNAVHKLSSKGDKLLQSFNFNEEVSTIYIDNQDSLWVGTFGGIYVKDLRQSDVIPQLLIEIDTVSVLKKQGKTLWIGTFSGLYQYNLHKKELKTIPQMHKMHVRDISFGSRDGQVWVCTYGDGFYLYANEQLKKMPVDRHGYLNTAHCILEDDRGFFWISTNKGLFQVAVEDLLAYSKDEKSQVYYQYYNESYGFNINEFNGGCQPCAAKLKDGNFVYPSLIGSVFFNPILFKANLPNKPIFIDRIFRDQESIKLSDTITIDQNLSRLYIWASSPYFGNPDNMVLEYKLDSDVSWAKLDGTSMITFNTLAAGKHELLIRKLSGFGNRTTYKSLTIIVKPYFYQTWWFFTLLFIYILGLITYFFKRRTRLILRKNERLEHLVNKRTEDLEKYIINLEESQYLLNQQTTFQKKLLGAITHDLKSPLKYMMIMGKKLYQNEGANTVVKDHLRTIYVSANSMYHFTENLLNYSKLFLTEKTSKNDYINLKRLVAEKISIFAEIARYNGTVIHNNIPDTVTLFTNRIMLTVIIHNLLDNAIKFCPNGEVIFDAKSTNGNVNFWIQDTGYGMPISTLNWLNGEKDKDITDGLGLKMVKEFASKMNLQLEVKSNTNEGTTIKLSLTHFD